MLAIVYAASVSVEFNSVASNQFSDKMYINNTVDRFFINITVSPDVNPGFNVTFAIFNTSNVTNAHNRTIFAINGSPANLAGNNSNVWVSAGMPNTSVSNLSIGQNFTLAQYLGADAANGNYTIAVNYTDNSSSNFNHRFNTTNITFTFDNLNASLSADESTSGCFDNTTATTPAYRSNVTNLSLASTTTFCFTATDNFAGVKNVSVVMGNESNASLFAGVSNSATDAGSNSWTMAFTPSSLSAVQGGLYVVNGTVRDHADNVNVSAGVGFIYRLVLDAVNPNVSRFVIDNSSATYNLNSNFDELNLTDIPSSTPTVVAFNLTTYDLMRAGSDRVGAEANASNVTTAVVNITRGSTLVSTVSLTRTTHNGRVDGAATGPACNCTWNGSYSFTNLDSAGTYTFTAVVTDGAGRINSTVTRTMRISKTAVAAAAASGAAGSTVDTTPGASSDLVMSGKSVDSGEAAGDSGSASQYRVAAGGSVGFTVNGESHSLTVDSIGTGMATVTVSSDPVTFDIAKGETKNVDLNTDGVEDIAVNLEKIISNKAYLKIWKLGGSDSISGPAPSSDAIPVDTGADTGLVDDEPSAPSGADDEVPLAPVEGGSNVWWWVLLVLVVIAGVVWYANKKK